MLSVLVAVALASGIALATALTMSAGLFLLARLEPAVVRSEPGASRSAPRPQPHR